MDKEFHYWMANRTTNVEIEDKTFVLAHYDVEVDGPRPGTCSPKLIELKDKEDGVVMLI